MKHSPELMKAAMLVLMTRLRKWDAENALEKLLGRDLLKDDDRIVATLCTGIRTPEDVTATHAIELLNHLTSRP